MSGRPPEHVLVTVEPESGGDLARGFAHRYCLMIAARAHHAGLEAQASPVGVEVRGDGAFRLVAAEHGRQRFSLIPDTDPQGRVHSGTIMVSVAGQEPCDERVRTYNFPQDRVSDHRSGVTVYGVEEYLSAGGGAG